MKKVIKILAALMLLSLAVSALAGLTGMLISPGTAKAGTLLFEAIPFGQTEKPVIPDGGGKGHRDVRPGDRQVLSGQWGERG